MRALLAAIFLLLSTPAWASVAGGRPGIAPSGGTIIPAPASANGFTVHTLSTQSFNTSNVDTAATYASGFQWYIWNYFGHTESPSNISVAGGILSAHGTTGPNGQIVSAAFKATSPGYVGTAYGCGGYFTAQIAFNSLAVDLTKGHPSWWMFALEHGSPGFLISGSPTTQQWTGQSINPRSYDHYSEIDQFEYDRVGYPYGYGGQAVDWYGQFGITCATGYCLYLQPLNQTVRSPAAGTDWSLYHTIALLWIPAVGGGSPTNGSLTFYFDDVQQGSSVSYSQFVNDGVQTPPPTASTPWTFGVIDIQHMILAIGAGINGSGAINVKSVDVWQNSSACNVTN